MDLSKSNPKLFKKRGDIGLVASLYTFFSMSLKSDMSTNIYKIVTWELSFLSL